MKGQKKRNIRQSLIKKKTLSLHPVFNIEIIYTINIIHMKLSKLLFIPLIGLFMGGCDMIDYHPYDVRISGPTDINNRNIAKNRSQL